MLLMRSVMQWFTQRADDMCLQDRVCLFKTSRPCPTLGIPCVQADSAHCKAL